MELTRIVKGIASLKLTVIFLLILVILIVGGTWDQAGHGLYHAQQKYFSSWGVWLLGFIPFPGTVPVLFALFLNLLASLVTRIGFRLANTGMMIAHGGILILLIGSFFTFYFSEESAIMLKKGESTTRSFSRHAWETAVWELQPKNRSEECKVYVVDTGPFQPGGISLFPDLNIQFTINQYHTNCTAFVSNEPKAADTGVCNASGIQLLEAKPAASEIEANIPGGVFEITTLSPDNNRQTLLLYGEDRQPTPVTLNGRTVYFSLRRKEIPLPLSMTLLDFHMNMHPNSSIPKRFESRVRIKGIDPSVMEREAIISMNRPLRVQAYTFFQASYFTTSDGTPYTILAVVKNSGRLIPYVSSITIFIGLLIHFLIMGFRYYQTRGDQ
ncbi:MAG: cytochrome c biogenesis protein ResB [Candidatus Omnitrophota bacterium]